MNTKEMIEVMQAYAKGKTIEAKRAGIVTATVCTKDWSECPKPVWDWLNVQYRVAPEPKKEGRWERVKIRIDSFGDYVLSIPRNGWQNISSLQHIPGFGGIDYRNPFNPKVIVRSMVPLMFEPRYNTNYVTAGDCDDDGDAVDFMQPDRPGIPVAAWFWKEGEK